MPDQNPGAEPQNPQTPATPPANPPAPAQTFTAEYVQTLRAESAGYRTQLRAMEKALREFLGLKPDDELKDAGALLVSHREAQEAALKAAKAAAASMLVKAEVKALGAGMEIIDTDAAAALADLSKVQVTDDGRVTGVKEALEALLQAKPYLKKPPAGGGQVGGGTNPTGGGNTPPDIDQQIEAAQKAGNLQLALRLKNQKFFGQSQPGGPPKP